MSSEGRRPKVAAIVLNYDGRDIALQALSSLAKMTYPAYDLVLVDNGSTDGSHDAVAEQHPDVTIVRTVENRGVAGGYNLGIEWAMARDYDYILLLNNDIEAEPTFLEELVAVAETDERIGCVGPKTYYFWERERLWSAGGIIRFREAVTRERGDGEIDRGQYDRDEEMGYVNGCGMLMRRSAVEATGLWDPIYHLAVEDADWCTRLRRQGFRIMYAHRAVLYHMVSYATGVYKPGRTFQTGRSTAIFVRRYADVWQWLRFLVFATLALPAAFVRELPKRNTAAVSAKLRGYIDGLRATMTAPPAWPGSKGQP